MSLNTKHTHVEEIIERVRREFGFEEVYLDDVREWVWDAIGIMGSPSLLLEKEIDINIKNHRGELPVDLYCLLNHRVRDKNSKRILKKSVSLFFEDNTLRQQAPRAYTDAETTTLDEDGNLEDGTKYMSIIAPEYDKLGYFYTIKENYIFVSKKETTIQLFYTAFPMDDRLFPMIPDDPKVIRAIVWYIGERLAFKYMLKEKLSERKYNIIKQDYLFNVASARTKADTLDIPELHNFKHRVLSMVKQHDAFEQGFK